MILDRLFEGVYLLDSGRRIQFWNQGAECISGYRAEEVMGRCCARNLLNHIGPDGVSLCEARCPVAATLSDGKDRETEAFLLHRAGHRVPIWIRVSALLDAGGAIVGVAEMFSDSTSDDHLRRQVDLLSKLSSIDPLTQLANRRTLGDRLAMRMAEAERYGLSLGVLFIDIDHFKQINDRHGHTVGDRVLQMVGRTLAGSLRNFDGVGRWGGEEFVALVINVDRGRLERVAERSRVLVGGSHLMVAGRPVGVTVSIGGAMRREGEKAADLLQRADDNMYLSKAAGRNRVTLEAP